MCVLAGVCSCIRRQYLYLSGGPPAGRCRAAQRRRPLVSQVLMLSPSVTIQREVADVDHVYEHYEEVVDRLPAFVQRFADSLTTAVFSPGHRASAPLTVAAAEVG